MQFERIAAAHSLNWKAPFLNKNIVEYVAKLPTSNLLTKEKKDSYLRIMMKGKLTKECKIAPMIWGFHVSKNGR